MVLTGRPVSTTWCRYVAERLENEPELIADGHDLRTSQRGGGLVAMHGDVAEVRVDVLLPVRAVRREP